MNAGNVDVVISYFDLRSAGLVKVLCTKRTQHLLQTRYFATPCGAQAPSQAMLNYTPEGVALLKHINCRLLCLNRTGWL